MKKVDFFIVGAPKAATTSLHHYLSQHLDVEMSSKKEPNYFSDESLQKEKMYYGEHRVDTIEKYHALFDRDDAILRGESSVSYLYYQDVPCNIKAYNSQAKIIIILRDPIERAFSHYLMDYRLGLISESFKKVITKRSKHPNSYLYYQQYVSVGEYSQQVKRYLDVFSQENILIIDYDEFKNNTSAVFKETLNFLALKDHFKIDFEKKYNTYSMPSNIVIRYIYSFVTFRKFISAILPQRLINNFRNIFFKSSEKPQMSSQERSILIDHFRDDINSLSKLLNRDFSKWIK